MSQDRYRRARDEANGFARTKSRPHEHLRPQIQAPPTTLALLRGTWARRDHLTPREHELTWSFLRRAERGPLSDEQLRVAKEIGARVGVGYDDPPVNDGTRENARIQPWGVLPTKPPRRV